MDIYTQTKLPKVIIAELYSNSLVITEDRSIKQSEDKGREIVDSNKDEIIIQDAPATKWWLGENLKNVTILLNDSNNTYISDDNLAFLSKILQACRLNIADTAIINLTKTPNIFSTIQQAVQPQYVILFNVKPSSLELPFLLKPYQPHKEAGCSFVLASSLTSMNNGTPEATQEKSRFWISLKQIFGI